MDQKERQVKIESYGDAYNQLVSGLERFPKEMWQFRDSHGCWSIHQHIVHIADSEETVTFVAGGSLPNRESL